MKDLKMIAEVLIKEETDFFELKETIENYKSIVYKLSELDLTTIKDDNDLFFDTGKALGTKWAALCLNDLLRTKKFVQGTYKAIRKKLKEKQAVKVLYAGTGPFATLILPILHLFSSDQLKVVLMEVNQETCQYLKKVINTLELNDYVQEYIVADASKFKFNENQRSDIVVSETMQRALEKEQQVAIMMNIFSQMKDDTFMIPQSIKLYAALISSFDPTLKSEKTYEILDTVFDLNPELINTYHKEFNESNEYNFPPKVVTITHDKADFKNFAILTEVQIFDDIVLKYNKSSLTVPLILNDISGLTENKNITTYYHASSTPSLKVTFEK
ncbi:SAM-dependent methyltransferase [Tenacibaculum xiamenense]|uniref:hypothetical protein n=1 Tax=Tenacibaculum xiamenense TaxID=1261553 RepID=UPI0038B68FC1